VTRTDAVKALHYEYVSRVHAAIGAQEQLRATWCSGATRCCCFDFYFLPQHTVHQRVASTLHRPYALPLPRVPRAVPLMTHDRPRPPGARRPRPPAQGAARGPRRATHGRGSGSGRARNRARAGLPAHQAAHVTNMLRYNDANDTRQPRRAGLLTVRVTVDRTAAGLSGPRSYTMENAN